MDDERNNAKEERRRSVRLWTGIVGAVLALLGVYLASSAFPMIIRYKVKQTMMLEEGSENMKAWLNLPTPLEFRIYIYNVTNPNEVQNGAKPVLEQIGPYVYDEHIERVDVSEGTSDDSLSYMSHSTYLFNSTKSGGLSPQDLVTVLNVPLVGTALMVEEMFPVGLSFVNLAEGHIFGNMSTTGAGVSNLFIRAPVDDLLFGGLLINCSAESGAPATVCKGIASRAPVTVAPLQGTPHFKFAFFRHKNNSLDGRYKINRGRKDISKLGEIQSYRNSSRLEVWPENSTCNRILGTDSTIFPPFVDKARRVYIFITDVCSSVFAEYESEGYEKGLPVLRFTGSYKNFGDALHYPENRCRCRRLRVEECLKGGVIDATNCHGAPVIFSMPHLYRADPEYTNYAKGMNPNKEKHETFVWLEPYTSVPIEGWKRLQLNMFLKKLSAIDVMANVSEGLFPILWIEEGATLDNDSLSKLHQIYSVVLALDVATWILIGGGILCLLASLVLYLKSNGLFRLGRENRVRDSGGPQKTNVFTLSNNLSRSIPGASETTAPHAFTTEYLPGNVTEVKNVAPRPS